MELTEERLAEIEDELAEYRRYGGVLNPAWVTKACEELAAEVRRLRKILDGEDHKPGAFDRMTDWAQQMEGKRDEARGLAREYLYALWEEDSEEVRKAARAKEAEFHPWLLEPEPATATGVAEAVFGKSGEPR